MSLGEGGRQQKTQVLNQSSGWAASESAEVGSIYDICRPAGSQKPHTTSTAYALQTIADKAEKPPFYV